jgi:hypothetical protein
LTTDTAARARKATAHSRANLSLPRPDAKDAGGTDPAATPAVATGIRRKRRDTARVPVVIGGHVSNLDGGLRGRPEWP